MLASYHYIRSIPEAINTALSVKSIKIILLLGINAVLLTDYFTDQVIVIEQHDTKDIRAIDPNVISEKTMTVTALYYALRLGNVSEKTIPQINELARRVLPYRDVPDALEKLKVTHKIFSETGIKELFIPTKVNVHAGMKRAWVTGDKYLRIPGKEEKKTRFTREFEFDVKRGFIYPTYTVQYAGDNKSHVQIQDWIKTLSENS